MATSESEWAYGVPVNTTIVAGEVFCVPRPVDLVVKKKIVGLSEAQFQVFDAQGNLLLQVSGTIWRFHKKRVMRDPAGFAILTLREKAFTWRHRWTVHRGESSDDNNLLFNAQRSHPLQFKSQLDVFLATNFNHDISNFHVSGCWSNQSCKIYKGDTIIAEVSHKYTWNSFFKGKDNFVARVDPGVDYAFVVALIVILNEIDHS